MTGIAISRLCKAPGAGVYNYAEIEAPLQSNYDSSRITRLAKHMHILEIEGFPFTYRPSLS